ncbi:MAG: S41 family peptidase, partial [Chitinophagaceae bacterium]
MLQSLHKIANTKINFWLVVLCCLLFSCSGTKKSSQYFKLGAQEAKGDLQLLKKVLETKHPALYRYQSVENFNQRFQHIIESITDSIHQLQLRNKVAYLLEPIRCGHTTVRFSKQLTAHLINRPLPQFPLYIKTWKDSLVVLANTHLADSVIKRGTIVTHINEVPAANIIDSIFKLMSTDGYANNFKSQVISTNFPYWYRMAWGTDSIYQIQFINDSGKTAHIALKTFTIQKKQDSSAQKLESDTSTTKTKTPKPIIIPPQSLQLDTINKWGYLKISSFSSKGLRRFIKRSFKTIEQHAVKHLIIDIRENGGGKLQLSTLLTRFLKNSTFTIADTVAAKDRSLAYSKHLKGLFAYWFPMRLTKKQKDALFHYQYLEKKEYHPKSNYHFNGKIYILQ